MLKCNNSFDLKNSNKYIPSEVAKVRFCSLPDGNVKCESDVSLLFNQDRIVKTLGIGTAQRFIDRLDTNMKQKGFDRKNLDDDKLLQFIKDRNIQSPSEMLAWTQYIMDNFQKTENSLKSEIDELQQRQLAEQEIARQNAQAKLQDIVNTTVQNSK